MDSYGGLETVRDLPVIRDGKLAWIDGADLSFVLTEVAGNGSRCFIERVHSMPKQGVASSFAFGVAFGSVLGVLRARGIAIQLVTPAQWKRELGLSDEKGAALDKARLLYPGAELDLSLKKHHGRAEAILIAHWGRTFWWRQK